MKYVHDDHGLYDPSVREALVRFADGADTTQFEAAAAVRAAAHAVERLQNLGERNRALSSGAVDLLLRLDDAGSTGSAGGGTGTVNPGGTATVDPGGTSTIDSGDASTVDPTSTSTVNPGGASTVDPSDVDSSSVGAESKPAGASSGHSSGASVGELARAAGFSSRNVTGLVDTLERAGLVRRAPDPGDRRAVLVTITDAGRGWVADFREPARRAMGALFHGFTDAEVSRLRDLCLRLVVNQEMVARHVSGESTSDRGSAPN